MASWPSSFFILFSFLEKKRLCFLIFFDYKNSNFVTIDRLPEKAEKGYFVF